MARKPGKKQKENMTVGNKYFNKNSGQVAPISGKWYNFIKKNFQSTKSSVIKNLKAKKIVMFGLWPN